MSVNQTCQPSMQRSQERRPWSHPAAAIAALLLGVPMAAKALPRTDNVKSYTVDLKAKRQNQILQKVFADESQLRAVEFRPGDTVVVSRNAPDTYLVEKWTQVYTWPGPKKGGFLGFGGHREIEHKPSIKDFSLDWNTNIVAVLSGADAGDFTALIAFKADKTEYRCNTNTNSGGVQLNVEVKRPAFVCPLPPGAPGNAKPTTAQPTVEAQVPDGQKIGSITIKIVRPSSSN